MAQSSEISAGNVTSAASSEEDAQPGRLLCWICRRPLDSGRAVRFRGEPVHPDCY